MLPLYYTEASHFLLQIKDIKSRRSICFQILLYLSHLRNYLSKPQELTDVELLTKTTLSLVRKMAGRNDLIEVINKHLEREKMWNQWKATRATVLVANHRAEEHVEMTVDRTARPMSDVRLLSRRNTMSGFVGVVGGRDSVAGGVARGEPGRVGRCGEVMRGAAADGEWREGDGHDAGAERVCAGAGGGAGPRQRHRGGVHAVPQRGGRGERR